MTSSALRRAADLFALDRHALRSTLPAQIQEIMQNGLLDRVFQDTIVPLLLFPQIADVEPWGGGVGDTRTFTRPGLMPLATTPTSGSDPSPSTYAFEQYSVIMDQYSGSVDTNMLTNKLTLASKWLQDVKSIAIQGGQSINQVARDKLYAAYAGGRTWATSASTSSTSLVVQSTNGFAYTSVNGVPTPVSGATPLNITVNGVANTVTGVNAGTNTLTLGTAISAVVGQAVVSSVAPVSIRPSGNSAFDLTTASVSTLSQWRAGVARLRSQNVPTVNGYYVAHLDSTTETELFADPDFKQALQGRVDSPIFRDLSIGRFSGIDWVRNELCPTVQGGNGQNLTIHRPILFGANTLVSAPLDGTDSLLDGTGVEDIPNIAQVEVASGVSITRIVRPPQDRLQQILSTSWAWTGDFGVPSDGAVGDASLFKRAVVLEHA